MEGKLGKSHSFNKKIDKPNIQKSLFSRLGSPFTPKSLPNSPLSTPVTSSSSINELVQTTSEKELYADILEIRSALNHFLNSEINEAEALLQPRYKESMYHALGFSFILFLKCVMTFQEEDIVAALEALKNTIQLAGSLRKKENGWFGSVTSWMKGTTLEDIKHMTTIEKHAELVFAEAYLLKALLSIIHDESVMSFLRESLNIRSSYNTYMTLQKYLDFIDKGGDGEADADFVSGVYLGVGCFSLILSMLPASVIKVAEFIGFTSDRAHGLYVLAKVGGWKGTKKDDEEEHNGLRRPLCDMVLIVYHVILSKMIPLSGVDIPFAEQILNDCLKRYPRGVFFLYFNGRLMASKKLIKEATEQYHLAIDTQKDWKQLQHMCFWELGIIYNMERKWQEAYDVYSVLQKESNWSKAVYTYLKAVTLYMLANETEDSTKKTEYLETVNKLMDQVSGEKQKIAGKSIPMEKFVSRKSRKFKSQNNYLLLPDIEMLNAFTAFDFIPKDILEKDYERINAEIDRLEKLEKKTDNYYDDYCLAEFLRGITSRELYEASVNKEEMKQVNKTSLQTVFDNANKIVLDHYIYYFSHYENARMLLTQKEYTKSESEIQIVLKANDKGQYNVGAGPHAKNKYSLASALVFKCHNLMAKVKAESKQ